MDKISTAVPEPTLTKSEWRERQRKLSFAEKIAVLEKLRERDALIAKVGLRHKRSGSRQGGPQSTSD